MWSFYRLAISLITIILFANPSYAQNVEVDISACRAIFHIFSVMKSGASKEQVSSLLDSVLQTKPYRVMFKHYNRSWRPNHLPVPVFKNMIMSLQYGGSYLKGSNQRADQMLPFWKQYYDNSSLFRQNLDQLDNGDLKTLIDSAVANAKSWLPDDWQIPDFYMPILPNGGSRAFAIDTVQGYDFFQLPRDSSGNIRLSRLYSTLSHESHHLGIKTIYPTSMTSKDSIAYGFLSIFAGEGTANKFINNYPGGCVPAIDRSRDSTFDNDDVAKWWLKYTAEEDNLFDRLTKTFEQAYSGSMSRQELETEISQFWLSGYVSPVYFIGSELFGAVYYGHGKQGAFTAMRDLRKLFSLYNEAIKARPDVLGRCYLIPDSTVQHALDIGG